MSEGCFGAAKRLLGMLKRNTDSLTLWDNFTMHNLINVKPPQQQRYAPASVSYTKPQHCGLFEI